MKPEEINIATSTTSMPSTASMTSPTSATHERVTRVLRSSDQLGLRYDGYEEPPHTGPVHEDPSTVQLGATAEQVATEFLLREGYRIVERNFRCKVGELDVVARDRNGTLCFIEV